MSFLGLVGSCRYAYSLWIFWKFILCPEKVYAWIGRIFKKRRFAPMSEIVGAGKLEQKCLISEGYSKRKKEERKTWLKQGKSICIIGMLSKKQRQIRTT